MTDPIRECGPCTACCIVFAVSELEKGRYEPCVHLCATGCGIYEDRPDACRRFECQWLRGVLEPDDGVDVGLRPNACGVIFDFQPDTPHGDVYVAWEVEPGASGSDLVRRIIARLEETCPVVVMPAPELQTPPEDR